MRPFSFLTASLVLRVLRPPASIPLSLCRKALAPNVTGIGTGILVLFLLAFSAHAKETPGGKASQTLEKIRRKNQPLDTITGFFGQASLGASYNGLGLLVSASAGYRLRLYPSDNVAFDNNSLAFVAHTQISPAWVNLGASVVLQPASFFIASAGYLARIHFPAFQSGTFFRDVQHVRSLFQNSQNPVKSHIDGQDRLQAYLDQDLQKSGSRLTPICHLINAEATLQVKLFNVVAVGFFRYTRWYTQANEKVGFDLMYESNYDFIIKQQDDLFSFTGILGYEWRQFLFLATVSYRYALASEATILSVGPGFQWQIANAWGAVVKKPSLTILLNWYILHAWRGMDGVPYVAAQFGIQF